MPCVIRRTCAQGKKKATVISALTSACIHKTINKLASLFLASVVLLVMDLIVVKAAVDPGGDSRVDQQTTFTMS